MRAAKAPSEAAYRVAIMPDVSEIAAAPSHDRAWPHSCVQALEAEGEELRRVERVGHGATSWRMTAPLRALARRMRVRRARPDTPHTIESTRRKQ
jgi:hypothetical protein